MYYTVKSVYPSSQPNKNIYNLHKIRCFCIIILCSRTTYGTLPRDSFALSAIKTRYAPIDYVCHLTAKVDTVILTETLSYYGSLLVQS